MQNLKTSTLKNLKAFSLAAVSAWVLISSQGLNAKPLPALVDNFSHEQNNNLGLQRQLITDSVMGGQTKAQMHTANGVLQVSGQIVPARGQLGWASCALPLDANGQGQNAEAYEGVMLKVKVKQGALSISLNSTEVENFDFHASTISVTNDGKFHQIKLPFKQFKRAWSAQTALNPATINGISIVAYGMQTSDFAYEVDELSFY